MLNNKQLHFLIQTTHFSLVEITSFFSKRKVNHCERLLTSIRDGMAKEGKNSIKLCVKTL